MIDCSNTVSYFTERERMTNSCDISCKVCPLNGPSHGACSRFEEQHPQEAIKIVQKWSDEHPCKTYKDDFYEKFPNAKTQYTPSGCVNILYGLKKYCEGECEECWNEPMSLTKRKDDIN